MSHLFRAKHDERMRSLGVPAVHLGFKSLPRITKGETVRVLQWNLLADGMANDGFLVRDVLGDAPGEDPMEADTLAEKLSEIVANKGDIEPIRQATASPRAANNHATVVDWEGRWARMQEAITTLEPDIITLQELDHMAEFQPALASLGFSCGRGLYAPAHAAALGQGSVL